jgi:hypothetical protein
MNRRQVMIITWTDDRQETYPFTHQETVGGELHIWTEHPGAITYQRHDEWWFPLGNVRTRKAEDA